MLAPRSTNPGASIGWPAVISAMNRVGEPVGLAPARADEPGRPARRAPSRRADRGRDVGAVADRVDVVVGPAAQLLVDEHAAGDVESGQVGELDCARRRRTRARAGRRRSACRRRRRSRRSGSAPCSSTWQTTLSAREWLIMVTPARRAARASIGAAAGVEVPVHRATRCGKPRRSRRPRWAAASASSMPSTPAPSTMMRRPACTASSTRRASSRSRSSGDAGGEPGVCGVEGRGDLRGSHPIAAQPLDPVERRDVRARPGGEHEPVVRHAFARC